MPLDDSDNDTVTFVCHSGSCFVNIIPFFLKNEPATFQRALHIALCHHISEKLASYTKKIFLSSKMIPNIICNMFNRDSYGD